MRNEFFKYDEVTDSVISIDPSVEIVGYSGFAMTQGTSVVFRIEGKLRGLSMVYGFVDCAHGRPMIVAEGVSRRRCTLWTNIRLEGRARVKCTDGRITEPQSEPFENETDRQKFIPIAVGFLSLHRKFRAPVARLEFRLDQGVENPVIEYSEDN